MPEPIIRSFIGRDYSRANREAHRRRATRLDAPTLSLYVGLYPPLPEKDRTIEDRVAVFTEFFSRILAPLNHARPGTEDHKLTADRIRLFVAAAAEHYATENPPSDAPQSGKVSISLTRDFVDDRWERAVWRVEAHRDFIAITLNVGIDISATVEGLKLGLLGRKRDDCHGNPDREDEVRSFESIGGPNSHFTVKDLKAYLFNEMVSVLEGRLDALIAPTMDLYTDHDGGPVGKVFALIYGVIVPWTLIAAAEPGPEIAPASKVFRPVFPDLDEPRLKAEEQADARQRTNRFLTQYWPNLEGGILAQDTTDCVACYVQGGHGIYVSSLGAEIGESPEPVKYLLMYQDPALQGVKAPVTAKPPPPPSGKRWKDENPPYNFSWRISRFVNRLHDIGGARLAALSHHSEVSRFLQKARRIEYELRGNDGVLSGKTLQKIEADLRKAVGEMKMPVTLRASQIRHSQNVIKRLGEDLDIISLPTFQPYDQFLRRRVMGTLERMANAGDRYETIRRKLDSANISRQSAEILRIQQIADIVGALVFVYYTMAITHSLVKDMKDSRIVFFEALLTAGEISLIAGAIAAILMLWLTERTLSEVLRQAKMQVVGAFTKVAGKRDRPKPTNP